MSDPICVRILRKMADDSVIFSDELSQHENHPKTVIWIGPLKVYAGDRGPPVQRSCSCAEFY